MKRTLLFLSAFTCAISSIKAQNCSELFISEYVEGSGNDKALELYNPTASAINLTGYRVERFSNGTATSATGGVLNLSGTVPPFSTFVIVNGQTATAGSSPLCSIVLQGMADQLDGVYPAPTYMNGNDAIVLYKNTVIIDILGKTNDAAMVSSAGWGDEFPYDGSVGAVWTENHTLIRKPSVMAGVSTNPANFIVNTEWDSLPQNTWTNLGTHTCNCTLGLDELKSSKSFSVYPNPSINGSFTVSSQETIYKIELVDLLGKSVMIKNLSNFNKSTELNTTELEKGIYIVKIKYANNLESSSTIVIQ